MKTRFHSLFVAVALAVAATSQGQTPEVNEALERLGQQWKELSPKVTRNHLIFQRMAARSWLIEFKTLGTSDPVSLSCKPFFTGLPKVSQDGQTFYFVMSKHPGNRYVVALERFREPRILTELPQDAGYYDVSPDQKEIAFQQRMGTSGYKIFRRTNLASNEAVEFTDPATGGLLPAYSPDGSTIAYFSKRKLRLRKVATGEERILVDDPNLKELPTWSPDGREIAYQASAEDECSYDIYKVNVGNGEVKRLTTSAGLDVNPVFTADGQSILFTSDRVYGAHRPTICIMSRDGENKQHDASAGRPIFLPAVSLSAVLTRGPYLKPAPDKATLEVAARVTTVAAAQAATPTPSRPIATQQLASVVSPAALSNSISYTFADLTKSLAQRQPTIDAALDGQHLFYLARTTTGVQLLAHRVGSGVPKPLAELPHSALAAPDIGADRSKLVFKFIDQAGRSTHLVKLERGQPAKELVSLPLTPDLAFEQFDVAEDESFFVFDVRVEEGSTIYRHEIATGKTEPLLPGGQAGVHPTLSPVGQQVAYISAGAVRTINLADKTERIVVEDANLKQFPSWFGASQVIYQASTGEVGGFDVYVSQSGGSVGPPARLTRAAGDDMMPSIHGPSGRILFVSDRENAGYPEMFSMMLDGTGQQREETAGQDLHFPR